MTLQGGVLELSLWVKLDLLVLGADQVEYDMAAELTNALSIAEPFVAAVVQALDYGLDVVHAAIGALVGRQIVEIVWLHRCSADTFALVLAIDGAGDLTELIVRDPRVLKAIVETFKLIELLVIVILVVEIFRANIALGVAPADSDVILGVQPTIVGTAALFPTMSALEVVSRCEVIDASEDVEAGSLVRGFSFLSRYIVTFFCCYGIVCRTLHVL